MLFGALGFVQQGLEHLGHACAVGFIPDGGDVGCGTELLPDWEKVLHVDGCIHDVDRKGLAPTPKTASPLLALPTSK
jgi:hypothetical protein